MWDVVVLIPDHCASIYINFSAKSERLHEQAINCVDELDSDCVSG